MSCQTVQQDLLGFHFGELGEAPRRELEGHLEGCGECLRSYLALKRSVETAADQPAPSPALRSKLRAAVAQELGLGAPTWRWWERPFAFGFAGVAVLVAMLTMHAVATSPAEPPVGLVSMHR